jgi:hypothetical protein
MINIHLLLIYLAGVLILAAGTRKEMRYMPRQLQPGQTGGRQRFKQVCLTFPLIHELPQLCP